MAPALFALIGLALNRYADVEAETRRNKLLQAMQAYQVGKAQQSEGAIKSLMSTQSPDARAKELSDLQGSRAASIGDTVRAVQATNPAPIGGKVSNDYIQSQDAAAARTSDRVNRAISQLSIMGAPGERDVSNSLRFGRAAGTVDSANTAINNVGDAYTTSMRNVTPSPWMKMLGTALTAYGMGAAGGEGSTFENPMATGMGANPKTGAFSFEDSAGNTQQSAFNYGTAKKRRGFWGN